MTEQIFDNQKEVEILKNSRKTSFFLGLSTGVAVASTLAFVGLFVLVLSGKNVASNKNETAGTQPKAAAVNQQEAEAPQPNNAEVPPITADDHIKGNENAKVTLIEYSDFQCPYCARHYQTIKKIFDEYGDKVRLVYRHFPLSFHPEAQKAAEASECAAEQGKFWEMHDAIFEANLAGTMSVTKWKEEAKKLGLNTKKFNDCLDSGKYANKVSNQMAGGSAAGVQGTPATFVNGELVEGAIPYEQFKAVIESKL
jgi:protein-disulfide isomerase